LLESDGKVGKIKKTHQSNQNQRFAQCLQKIQGTLILPRFYTFLDIFRLANNLGHVSR
jgi:hypothetical protein